MATPFMANLRMQEKLRSGECLDVREEGEVVQPGVYRLRRFVEGVDYCDAETEEWIWSIGRRHRDGAVLASTGTMFYQDPDFECLFLR